MAEIYADLFLNSNDRLIISECDTQNIIYDSNSSVSKHKRFYTQAEEICVQFASSNNTQEKRNFFWNTNGQAFMLWLNVKRFFHGFVRKRRRYKWFSSCHIIFSIFLEQSSGQHCPGSVVG